MSLRVLFAASEAAPLSKTGGLADVASALPAALQGLGCDLRVVTPAYRGALDTLAQRRRVADIVLQRLPITIWEGQVEAGGPLQWLVDCPELYHRQGSLYTDAHGNEYADNAQRYGIFGELVARLALGQNGIGWRPEVVHLNDWHTGLAAAWLAEAIQRPACVFTIHNLAYQGNFPPEQLAALDLPAVRMIPGALEFQGQVSFLKAGLVCADALTTVSPTYAQEIQTSEFGEGMDAILRSRASVLTGIVNGIDDDTWNPATDRFIPRRFDARCVDEGKLANRRALQPRLGFELDDRSLLVVFIGRLAHQKGADLLLAPEAAIDREGVQFALLGAGDRELEQAFADFARRRPGRIAATFTFDEALAHLMEAAADALVMPSRFEPCGLNQMYSQRYGTVPVVRRTGGLVDTVTDATPATLASGTATGVSFDHADVGGVAYGIGRAMELRQQRQVWSALQRNGMRHDFSWAAVAHRYIEVYRRIGPHRN